MNMCEAYSIFVLLILIQETRSIRVTDLKEYSEDFLPKARMRKLNEMEIIRNVIMKEFNAYKKKKQKQKQSGEMRKKEQIIRLKRIKKEIISQKIKRPQETAKMCVR